MWARGARKRKIGAGQGGCLQHPKGSRQSREVNVLRFPGGRQGSELEKGSVNSGLAGRALRAPHPVPEGPPASPRPCLSEAV